MEDTEFTRSAAVLQTAMDAVDADVADAGKLSELLAVMQEHVLNHRNPWRMKRIVMEKYSSNRGNIGAYIAASMLLSPLCASIRLGFAVTLLKKEPAESSVVLRMAEDKLNEYHKKIVTTTSEATKSTLFNYCIRSVLRGLDAGTVDPRSISATPSSILDASILEMEKSKIPITLKALQPFVQHGGSNNLNKLNFSAALPSLEDTTSFLSLACLSEISLGPQLIWVSASLLDTIGTSASSKTLTKLDLAGSRNLSLDALAKLSLQCPNITDLSIRQCSFETELNGVEEMLQSFQDYFSEPLGTENDFHFAKLIHLDASETEIFPNQLVKLLERTSLLETLNISRCQCLGESFSSVNAILPKLPNLRIVDISFSYRLRFELFSELEMLVAIGVHPNVLNLASHGSTIVVIEDHAAILLSKGSHTSMQLVLPVETSQTSWNRFRSAARESNTFVVGVETIITMELDFTPQENSMNRAALDDLDSSNFGISSFVVLPFDQSKLTNLGGDGSFNKSLYDSTRHELSLPAQTYHQQSNEPNPLFWFCHPTTLRRQMVLKIKKNYVRFDLGTESVGMSNAKLAECLCVASQLLQIQAYDHCYVESFDPVQEGVFKFSCGS